MGNSEVGHLTIGAGRVVRQDLVRVSDAVADGRFRATPALVAASRPRAAAAACSTSMGLVSDGGVHSHVDHLRAIVELARAPASARPCTPSPTAGTSRRTRPRACSSPRARVGRPGRIATVGGRLWAMDRDRRFERTERACAPWSTAWASRRRRRARRSPRPSRGRHGRVRQAGRGRRPLSGVTQGDPLVFFNFRPDRARQMCHALAPAFGLARHR